MGADRLHVAGRSGRGSIAASLSTPATINILWSTDRVVYLTRSFDRGATWSSWLPLELPGDWLLTGCEMVVSDDGNVHLCIRACHPGPDDIYSRPENILFSYTRFAAD